MCLFLHLSLPSLPPQDGRTYFFIYSFIFLYRPFPPQEVNIYSFISPPRLEELRAPQPQSQQVLQEGGQNARQCEYTETNIFCSK